MSSHGSLTFGLADYPVPHTDNSHFAVTVYHLTTCTSQITHTRWQKMVNGFKCGDDFSPFGEYKHTFESFQKQTGKLLTTY